jgi:hypothetical protein
MRAFLLASCGRSRYYAGGRRERREAMFCPLCKSEYVEGVKECYDCHLPLVKELPDLGKEPAIEFEEVLQTYNQGDIAVIRSLLDNEEIQYFFRGEIFNLVDPLIQPARLHVRKDQSKRVRELLANLSVTFLGVSTGSHTKPTGTA